MTLRDELEKKLRSLYVHADSDVFGLLADEVIRQMEWARHLAESKWSASRPQIPQPIQLSLAPEDWTP